MTNYHPYPDAAPQGASERSALLFHYKMADDEGNDGGALAHGSDTWPVMWK